jgi:hypothetical protein
VDRHKLEQMIRVILQEMVIKKQAKEPMPEKQKIPLAITIKPPKGNLWE